MKSDNNSNVPIEIFRLSDDFGTFYVCTLAF